jgi:hypothetical protein
VTRQDDQDEPWPFVDVDSKWRYHARCLGLLVSLRDLDDDALQEKNKADFRFVRKHMRDMSRNDVLTPCLSALLRSPVDGLVDLDTASSDDVAVSDAEADHATARLKCSSRRFEVWEATADVRVCDVCREVHVVHGILPGSQPRTWKFKDVVNTLRPRTCMRCDSSANGVSAFGFQAGIYHPPIWNELEDLTYAEQVVIARIQPIVAVKMLQGGARSMAGTVCFVERTDDVGEPHAHRSVAKAFN